MSRPIDAVLFDFGGVFTESPFDAVAAASAELGATPELLADIVFGSYADDTDHPWHRLERGELTLGEARDAILSRGRERGIDVDPYRILAGMARGGGGAREVVVERVRDLRASGYRTAMITNNVAEFRHGWRKLLPVEELFEVVIDSSEVGMRKPDPRIYALALARLGGITPHRSVFLDDFHGNVHAARQLGIHGVLVGPDPLPALAELDRILGH